jgi:NADPH:quinone reductase
MRAIRPKRPGGVDILKLEEFATPSPGPDEALVRVEVAGVNFLDIHQRAGDIKNPSTPIPLGVEGAGVVEAVGDDVTDVSEGMRVAWASCPGSYATHLVAKADKLVPIPDGIETRVAGAAMMQGVAAHYLANRVYPLKARDFAVVLAAAGGVGMLLCQMAMKKGAKVIGVVSTQAKAKAVRELGLEHVFLYGGEELPKRVKSVHEAGATVVYDSVGKDTFPTGLKALRPRGMYVLFGRSSGDVPPLNVTLLARKSLFLTRPRFANYTRARTELLFRANAVFEALAAGTLKVHVGATFPLAAARIAHTKLASRETMGKVLLLP